MKEDIGWEETAATAGVDAGQRTTGREGGRDTGPEERSSARGAPGVGALLASLPAAGAS